jgi:tetratricopeptide (TPR) repeat protein
MAMAVAFNPGGAGVAAIVVAALGAFWLLPPAGDPSFDHQACLNLSGDGALKACDRAMASGHFDGREAAALFATRGYQRQAKNDLAGALSDYGQAIERDPTFVTAFNNRGNIYRDKGDYDQAIADYDRALALNPDSPDPLASRGWIYHQKGELDRAREDFTRALALKPEASLKVKLEQALAEIEPKEDPEVISDPSGFSGVGNGETAASTSVNGVWGDTGPPTAPAAAMPASPPALPPPGYDVGPAGGLASGS